MCAVWKNVCHLFPRICGSADFKLLNIYKLTSCFTRHRSGYCRRIPQNEYLLSVAYFSSTYRTNVYLFTAHILASIIFRFQCTNNRRDDVAILIVGKNLQSRDIVFLQRNKSYHSVYGKHIGHMIRYNIPPFRSPQFSKHLAILIHLIVLELATKTICHRSPAKFMLCR